MLHKSFFGLNIVHFVLTTLITLEQSGSTCDEKYSDSTTFFWNTVSQGYDTDMRWSPYVQLITGIGYCWCIRFFFTRRVIMAPDK